MSTGIVLVNSRVRCFCDFEELAGLVDQAGGVLTVNTGALRNAAGAGRLGVHIREAIAQGLRTVELGHLPVTIPDDQTHAVVLFLRSSHAGRAVQPGLDLAATRRGGLSC
jgi:hypothetical protein